MAITPEELAAIKAAAIAGLSSPAVSVRDGDQQLEMRGPRDIAEVLAICAELEDRESGRVTGAVVLCPLPVTL